MKSKVVHLVTKKDKEDYMLIIDALSTYDDWLHSTNNLRKAIKVRALMRELEEHRKERFK
tara:strand:+ start:181 stop:360 length:180 start_codon:yes stop_codon:yes gene_type:complete